MPRAPRAVIVLAVFLTSSNISQPASADSAPLSLYASNVSKAAIEPLVPICANAAGTEVDVRYANNPQVAKDIAEGAAFDVAVIETHMLRDLAKKHFVARDSIRALAVLRMGIATREIGPSIRTDTIAEFRHALLGARSIGYIGNGHSGQVFLKTVDRLRLREKLADKLVPFDGAYAEAAEASETLQFVVAPFFNPLPSPLRLVGYFPKSLGGDVDVSVGASIKNKVSALKFITCLKSPEARTIFMSKGYRLAK